MKIMHVMAGAENGGAEMAYVDMVTAQHRAGLDVMAVCRANEKRSPLLRDAGVPLIELAFGGYFDFSTRRALKGLIAQHKPDIVQTWMTRASQKTPSGPVAGHDYIKMARLGGYYPMKHYRDVDFFIAQTPDLKDHIAKTGHVDPNRIQQINQFAETGTRSGTLTRGELNTPHDAFVFLSLGRYHVNKGLDTLLRAFQSVPEAHLWLAGEGPEREALTSLAEDLGLLDRVHFLGWRTDRADLLDLCNCVVFPSRHEPFGTVFAQAWAAKRPLVTTASQGPAQFVKDQDDALLTPIDDVQALSKAMNRVMDDSALASSLIQNGFDRYEGDFSQNAVMDRTIAWYQHALDTA